MAENDTSNPLSNQADPKWARFCPRCGNRLADRLITEAEQKTRRVCVRCGFIFYLNPKVAAGAIPRQFGKIWLIRRNIEPSLGSWTFPGGYVDLGECVTDAAVRETYEETRLEIQLDRLLNVYSYRDAGIVMIAYCATVTGGEPAITPESTAIQAFSREEIPWADLAFPSTREALREYVEQERF